MNRHSVKSVTEKYWAGLDKDQQVFLDWYNVMGPDWKPTLNHTILNSFIDYLVILPMYIAMDLPRARRFERAIRQWCETNLGDQSQPFWNGDHWSRVWGGTWYNHKKPESATVAQALKMTRTGVIDHDMLTAACNLLLEEGSELCYCGTTERTQRDPKVIVDAFLLISRLALRSGCEFARMLFEDYDEDARILMLRSHKPADRHRAKTKLAISRQWIVVESELAHEILVRRRSLKKEGELLFGCSDAKVADLNTIMHRVAKKLKWDDNLNWVLHALRHGTAQETVKDVDLADEPAMRSALVPVHMKPATYKTTYGVSTSTRLAAAKVLADAGIAAPMRGQKRNRNQFFI